MCGVNAIWGKSPFQQTELRNFVQNMNNQISHRGPDNNSVRSFGDNCVLGHVRLSILDTTDASNQPFTADDGNVALTYNGEIYNYLEIKALLNLECETSSDTEVLVKGFEKIGHEIFPLLNGMFGFVIYDARSRSLTLARDRFGIKPLYYSVVDEMLIVSSEIKAFFTFPNFKKKFNSHHVSDFLSYLTLPGKETFFSGVNKVLPGEKLVFNEKLEVVSKIFAEPYDYQEEKSLISASKLRRSFFDTVKRQSISDVPVGLFLSGGVDSNAILEGMIDDGIKPVILSATFDGDFESYTSEKESILRSARKHDLDVNFVEISEEDFWQSIDEIFCHQDEPLADPVSVPVFLLAKKAADLGTKVILVGEGADEIFFGYPSWLRMNFIHKLSLLNMPVHYLKIMSPFINRMFPERYCEAFRRLVMRLPQFWGGTDALTRKEKSFVGIKDCDLDKTDQKILAYFNEFCRRTGAKSKEDWFTYFDLKLRLPELMLMRVDKMAMAFGIETRVPFLDNDFTKTVMKIPHGQKVQRGLPKAVFKKALKSHVDGSILWSLKQGFNAPAEEWCLGRSQEIEKQITHFCQHSGLMNAHNIISLCKKNPRHSWRFFTLARWYNLTFG